MACTAYLPFPNANDALWKHQAPSFVFADTCCDGNIMYITLDGQNDTLATGGCAVSFIIDGSASIPAAPYPCGGANKAPCLSNDFGGALTVFSVTPGLIANNQSFQIVLALDRSLCPCIDDTATLTIYPVLANGCGGTYAWDYCYSTEVPITIDVADNAPFTINSQPLALSACPGDCSDVQYGTFTITNDSCLERTFHVELNGSCSAYLAIDPPVADFILAPGDTSGAIIVTYCPDLGVIESGVCSIDISTVTVGDDFGCDNPQSLAITYETNCKYICCDGACVPDINGNFDTLAECQASCFQVPFVPPASICNDCYNGLMLDGIRIDPSPCNTACSNIGDTLDILVNVSMPVRAFAIVALDQPNQIFYILGDWTAGFVNGTTFIVSGSTGNDGTYTTVTAIFDGTYTQITVAPNITFLSSVVDGIITVIANSCAPSVVLTVTNTDTGAVIYTNAYPVNPGDNIYDLVHLVLTDYGSHKVLIEACDCFGCVNCEWNIDVCQQYVITKECCYNYTLTDNDTTTPKILTIVVANLDASYSQTYTLDTSITNQLSIPLPADGIYTVTITNNLTDDVAVYNIIELCALNKCIKRLILEIMCREKDPCCTECDEKTLIKQRNFRFELNKIIALFFTLQALLKRHYIDFTGVFIGDSCSTEELSDINDVFVRLNTITVRCGHCKQHTGDRGHTHIDTTDNCSPCTSC